MTSKKSESHAYKDLIDFAITSHINVVPLKVWIQKADRKDDDNFLAFANEIKQEISDLKNSHECVLGAALLGEKM